MRTKLAIIACLAALIAVGCGNTKEERLKRRLTSFRTALPADCRSLFDQGRYDDCAVSMTEAMKTNKEFQTKLKIVKDEEAITLFDEKQTVYFFKEYFVEKKMLQKNWDQP